MKEVIASLRGVRGLVIDIRYNGGGQDAVALAIAGYFTDTPKKCYSKQAYFGGRLTEPYEVTVLPAVGDRLAVPLVFLTSDMTVSAAEIFALDLKALPSTVQLGQPTRGALSDRLEKVLPNGWSFSLSNEVYKDPHGRVFEVVGVPPDVVTEWPSPRSPDLVRFQRDIDAAMRILATRK
jgi:carboxyl-terminal processing protease